MNRTAIQIENLSKRYRLGAGVALHRTLGEAVHDWVSAALGRLRGSETTRGPRTFLALDNVSLTVQPGEVVGLVGRNGAGKSTLLKILSRITPPTKGCVVLRGRVGSLLEVGTGFHPELTGRENIFLNGAVLGMTRREIRRRFDEIVAFAEIGPFLGTPVKRYSSGMYVRLAFAVAAHLEPEILLVDEVLAVGDAAFQHKCLGKMGEVARGGRTVVFVSHNMKAVRALCTRAVLLDAGRVAEQGEVDDVTAAYLRRARGSLDAANVSAQLAALPADPDVRLLDVGLSQHGASGEEFASAEPIHIAVEYEVQRPVPGLRIYFDLCAAYDDLLIRSFHDEHAPAMPTMPPGCYTSRATLPAHLLAPRQYRLVVRAGVYNLRDCTGPGLSLPLRIEQTSRINLAYAGDPVRSKFQPLIPWTTEETVCPSKQKAA